MKKIIRDSAILLFSIAWFGGLFMVFGCKRTTTSTSHTIEIIKKDSLVFTPNAEVSKSLDVDSVSSLLSGHWYSYWDSLNRVQLSYMRDKFGRLNMQAKCPPDTIRLQTKTIIENHDKVRTITKNKTPIWAWLVMGGLGTLLLAILIGKALKRLGN